MYDFFFFSYHVQKSIVAIQFVSSAATCFDCIGFTVKTRKYNDISLPFHNFSIDCLFTLFIVFFLYTHVVFFLATDG